MFCEVLTLPGGKTVVEVVELAVVNDLIFIVKTGTTFDIPENEAKSVVIVLVARVCASVKLGAFEALRQAASVAK